MEKLLFSASLNLLLTLTAFSLTSPEWISATSYGPQEGTTDATAIQYDAKGNMYIAGTFTSSAITFGKISIQNTTSIKRAYLAKRSYRGEWLWAISPEGISTIVNIGLDKDGNIYTAGNFAGAVYFPTSISIKSYKFGVYVAKYSPDAACLWAKPAGSDAKTDSCKAAFTDENGNTYITGNFTGTFASGSLSATSAGGTDMFVSKITSDAKWGFLSCAKGQQNETGVAITADADYAYVAGNFTSDKTTFDAQYTIQKNGNQDFFIAKYETSLGYYKGSTYSSGKAVTTAEALILNKGYLFVSGSYTGLSIVGGKELPEANSYNTFIGMLDVDLNWNWQNIGIGASTMNAHALTFNNKIVYVGGEYKKECVFGDVRLSATENYGVYSAAIDIDGKWLDALSSPYASASPRLVTMSTFGDSVTVAGDYSGGFQLGKTVLPETKYQMGYSASFSTLQPDPILVTGIVFDKTALSFTAPTLGSSTITATISPVTATNKNIYWSSSDNKVATAAGGVITAVGVGTCTITAAATDGSGKSATGTVTVSKEIILVNDIYLNRTILDKMVAGTSQQIFATILPSDASNQSITWKNSDDAVATVDNLGTITAKAAGSCTITAYTNDGSNLSASCNVTVIAENILISSISLDNSLSLLLSSGSYLLTPIISPTNASNQRLAWESSDLNIAEVDASGKITPKSAGECKISATAADGSAATATCVVTIVKEGVYATDISLSAYTMSLTIGAQQALVAALIPANATNEPLSWQSDNDKIATVDQSGNVTAIAAGTATVIVSLQNNPNIYAKCAVTVNDIAPIIDYSSLKKAIAEANAVRSSILPENIGTKPGQYTQANLTNFDNAIANAETAYGQLTTQVQINSATSTLVSAITKFRNSINGAVPVAGVAFNVTKLNLNVKSAAYQIVPTISPADASNKVLRWLSSNPAVASVDQSGSVTALQGGTATIYATSTDGTSKSTYCTVAVTVPVASIDIQQYLTIKINETATLTPLILPDDATNKNVVWRSQFPEIAAVSVTGAVTGKSAGSAKITVTSADGAYSAVCIVNVMSSNIAITALSFKDTAMTAIVGSALSVPVGISPYNATGSFTWKSSVPAVATVQSGGIVQALTVGTALITATSSADPLISDTLTLTVLPSAYPVAALIAPLKFTVGVSSIVLDLADFVRDDNTAAQDMLFDPNGTAQLAASISSSILTVTPEIGWTGKDSIAVYATDQDGQSVRFKISFEISAAANTPPVISAIPHQTIQPGGMFMPLYLDKYVTDDFTRSSDIQWNIAPGANVKAYNIQNVVYTEVVASTWIGTDTLVFTATDKDGGSASVKVAFSVSKISNEAPIIAALPALEQTDSTKIAPLNLAEFVSDDYTMSENITWTGASTDKVNVVIENNTAYFEIIDPSWAGSEQILLTATDQFGAATTVAVTVSQKSTDVNIWNGIPYVNFYADQSRISTRSQAFFHGTITGTADSYEWLFDNASPSAVYNSLNPAVSYTLPGKYSVRLAAQNSKGLDSLRIDGYITVVGITTRDTAICRGDSITLAVSDQTLHKYLWSNGAVASSIKIAPAEDVRITLIATYGLTKFYDTINIKVNQPVDLGNDVSYCAGSAHTFSVDGYTSYSWNGSTASAVSYFAADKPGKLSLQVIDADGCTSSDTVMVSELPVPVVDLGKDAAICDGTDTALNAGEHTQYLWSTSATTRSITVADEGTYQVTVTATNGCTAHDALALTLKKPFAEPLGIATFSDKGDFIILGWERTSGMNTVKYEMMRESSRAGIFDVIAAKSFTEESYVWDLDAVATSESYQYKLRTYDACGNFTESAPHRTILVQTSPNFNDPSSVNISWNAYQGVALSSYHIQQIDAAGKATIIKTIPASQAILSYVVPNVAKGSRFRVLYDIPTEINPRRLKSDSGPYSQSLSNLSEAIAISHAGKSNMNVRVYPVPSSDELYLSVEGLSSTVKMAVYDREGRLVRTSLLDLSRNEALPLQDLPVGNYTIVIDLPDGIYTSEIVVN